MQLRYTERLDSVLVARSALVHLAVFVDTLARRIETEGPLAAREAVRLVSRLARAVEGMHASGKVHGRLGPHAVALPSPRLAHARLLPATRCADDHAYHSPERRSGGGISREDDAYATALTLYFALTGWKDEVLAGSTPRPPPLAVFDAGDDRLEQILDLALAPERAARRTLSGLRSELDAWLEQEGAAADEPLRLAADPGEGATLDVGSLPPPPAPDPSRARAVPKGDLFAVQDEDSTWRKLDPPEVPRAPRMPRLVPPKLSKPPPVAAEEEERPTLVREEDARRVHALAADAELRSTNDGAVRERTSSPSGFRPSWLVVVGGAAGAVAGGYLLLRDPPPAPPPAAASAASPSPSPSASPSPSPSASPSPSSSPSSSASPSSLAPSSSAPAASASASASADAAAATAPGACLETLFPEGTFENGASELAFVCEERNPVRGAPRVREILVKEGRGQVSDAMKEWALLGFYELGAYAVLSDRCCSSTTPPLELPVSPGSCPPLVKSLDAVARAARRGSKDKAVNAAITELDAAVRCITRSKQTKPFGGYPRPSGGEGTALKKTIARARGGAR